MESIILSWEFENNYPLPAEATRGYVVSWPSPLWGEGGRRPDEVHQAGCGVGAGAGVGVFLLNVEFLSSVFDCAPRASTMVRAAKYSS